MSFVFAQAPSPFARWVGPYSPSRGTKKSGFRFHKKKLGTWVARANTLEFWQVDRSPGVSALEALVQKSWGNGRILLLPDGTVIKPDQSGDGRRYLIGHIRGPIVVVRPDMTRFDYSGSHSLTPGKLWPGPRTTGIECKIDSSGRISCTWGIPATLGTLEQTVPVSGQHPQIAAALRAARPGVVDARVRIQSGGAVITSSDGGDDDDLVPHYLGQIDVACWPSVANWVVS